MRSRSPPSAVWTAPAAATSPEAATSAAGSPAATSWAKVGPRLQRPQEDEETVAVLASRDGDHDPISILDEAVIADGSAHVAEEAAFQIHVQPGAHATFIRAGGATMSEAVTTRRAKPRPANGRPAGRRQSVGWMLALGASALVHLGILVAFAAYGRSSEQVEAATTAPDEPRTALALAPGALPVEVTDIEVTELPPQDAPPPLVRPWDAPPGERDNPIARTRAPADSDSRD